jgi:hypothetical protein
MFRARRSAGTGVQQAADEGVQVEAAVDAILGLAEKAARVLVEIEMLVGPTSRGFAVGDEGVDPTAGLQVAGSARGDDNGTVGGA